MERLLRALHVEIQLKILQATIFTVMKEWFYVKFVTWIIV